MIIYKATCILNNKSYIGLTTRSLNIRKAEHERHSAFLNTHFAKALRKYGFENFEWTILKETNNINELQELEKKYIEEYNTFGENGYNMTNGGEYDYNLYYNLSRNFEGGNNPSARKVINLTTLEIYDCLKNAAESINYSTNSLHKSILNKLPLDNCYWDYYDKNKEYSKIKPNLEKMNVRKSIINITTNEIFKTISEAAEKYHCARKGIRDTCNGIRESYKGFKWAYKEING